MAAVLLAGVATARAGFTPNNAPPPGEASIDQVFAHYYGGTFSLTGSNGVDFSNGSITAVRLPDSLPGSSDAPTNAPGPNGDQIWTGTAQQATAKAVLGALPETFGYYPGASGGTFTALFPVSGTETWSVSGGTSTFSVPSTLRWGASTSVGPVSSLASDNYDSLDHMITYQMSGVGGSTPTYWLFFADRGFNNNSNYDYNDLVVQLQYTPSGTSSVPEPGSIMMLAGGALLLLKRSRLTTR